MNAVARQDGQALRLLIRKFRPMVFKTALRMVCDEAEAEDITQEVFIRIWKQAHRYDSRYRLSTWLYRITCNLSIDCIRKHRFQIFRLSRRSTGAEWKDISLPMENSSEEELIRSEDWRIFKEAAMKLSPKQRAVFTLKELEGLDTEEVSRITGMDADRIKSNLYLARKAIKERLSRQ